MSEAPLVASGMPERIHAGLWVRAVPGALTKAGCTRQSRASEPLFQAVLSGLERTNVRATSFSANRSTKRVSA